MSPLRLRPLSNPPSPFSWDSSPPPITTKELSSLASPPTAWLSARDMKIFGCQPMSSLSDLGVIKCKECEKPVLRSCMSEHYDLCAAIRAGRGKASKTKISVEEMTKGKKRKVSVEPEDPNLPAKKKVKPTPKVTKGRMKGPVDYDKQCGVINDKGLPCSRSLTCKSHSMGAKRSVQGRSRPYDELLLDWQRANNPNFVEPVKRESKAEKKAQREREKLEKKRIASEAAAALGIDPPPAVSKKASAAAASGKKQTKKAAAAAAAAVRFAAGMDENAPEDLGDLDSETELDELVKSVRTAQDAGVVGVPLAVPCDAGSWFVQRRERVRCCRDLFMAALGNGGNGIGPVGFTNRTASGGTIGGVRH
ncbi:SCA7, zinc-binding domain-containing protein [Ephemerocybe angulata]|uniref:SCA7, zinc-binding domain-containing protein n=1 Tax=Ephemerocybe angulata TaxID=980116 RepID=A0A8H6I9K6_9AGAR|nr:SCA7, zinc-binding domain-containing protein [Tulosesus angulatus]